MARPQPRVVAIGDATVDLVTPPMPPVPAADFQGEVSRFDRIPGGNATNFALQMASLGARTTFIGCVGADEEAAFLRRAYRRGRVRAILRVDRRRPTGATVALTWSDGRRALITSLGANAGLRSRDVPPSASRGADHVHRSGFWWTEGLIAASVHAKLRGAPIPDALQLGNACAAARLANRDRPYPTLARVRRLLRSTSTTP